MISFNPDISLIRLLSHEIFDLIDCTPLDLRSERHELVYPGNCFQYFLKH